MGTESAECAKLMILRLGGAMREQAESGFFGEVPDPGAGNACLGKNLVDLFRQRVGIEGLDNVVVHTCLGGCQNVFL